MSGFKVLLFACWNKNEVQLFVYRECRYVGGEVEDVVDFL